MTKYALGKHLFFIIRDLLASTMSPALPAAPRCHITTKSSMGATSTAAFVKDTNLLLKALYALEEQWLGADNMEDNNGAAAK